MPDDAWQLLRLMDGFVTTQLLYVAAKLGVAEALTEPKTGAALADELHVDADALTRVLRGLALEGVVSEDDGTFALTALGAHLPALKGPALVRGELYFHGAEGLLDAVKHGGTAFERIYDAPFFTHLDRHPDHEAAFEASMAGRAEQEAQAVVAAYDFTSLKTLVDVGGGRGVLLNAILKQAPHLDATLFDRPAAIEAARPHVPKVVAGDFFAAVPPGADAYLLSRVLHDWDDEDALRILATVRRAMRDDSRVLIVDAILPRHARDKPAAIRMDLHMLLLLGARERTEAEFRALLQRAGFEQTTVYPTDSPAGLSVMDAR